MNLRDNLFELNTPGPSIDCPKEFVQSKFLGGQSLSGRSTNGELWPPDKSDQVLSEKEQLSQLGNWFKCFNVFLWKGTVGGWAGYPRASNVARRSMSEQSNHAISFSKLKVTGQQSSIKNVLYAMWRVLKRHLSFFPLVSAWICKQSAISSF